MPTTAERSIVQGRRKAPPKVTANSTPAEQALRPVAHTVREIQAIEARSARACMNARHEIGKVLIRDFEKLRTAQQFCETRRLEIWDTLAEHVGLNAKTLRDCKRFAENYDEPEVARLVELGVTWTHVVHLLSLRTELEKEDFLKRVSQGGLTAAALRAEIYEEHGNRRRGSGKKRKPPEPPKTLKGGLKRAIEKVTRLIEEHDHALFCDEFDLAARIECEPPDEIKEEDRDQIDMLIELYDQFAAIAQRLREARPRLDRVFEEREQREKSATETAPEKKQVEARPDSESGKEHRSVILTAVAAGTDRTGFPAASITGK